jgi:T6SS immunity protein Tdi1, C-terminal
MLERFSNAFLSDGREQDTSVWMDERSRRVRGYEELMTAFAGRSFERGLYRIHSAETGAVGQAKATAAFPEFEARVWVFGFDWLGRQAALDFGRISDGQPLVLLLEPGTGEALEIPVGLVEFHEEEIIDYRDEALASVFFAEWVDANPSSIPLGVRQCVGYRVPLFLGGSDTIENLETSDFEVYWDFCGQLLRQSRGLPAETPITRVRPA